MALRLRRSLGPLVSLSLTACALVRLLPDERTPADRAREVALKCDALPEGAVGPMMAPSAVESAEPDYAYVSSGSGDREARLLGIRIHLGPAPGMSRESLERGLRCHQARVVLGQVRPSERDLYSLDGRWLDIDTESEGDGFVAFVRTREVRDARVLLGRARALVAGREERK
jgi:hypothetical protein